MFDNGMDETDKLLDKLINYYNIYSPSHEDIVFMQHLVELNAYDHGIRGFCIVTRFSAMKYVTDSYRQSTT